MLAGRTPLSTSRSSGRSERFNRVVGRSGSLRSTPRTASSLNARRRAQRPTACFTPFAGYSLKGESGGSLSESGGVPYPP